MSATRKSNAATNPEVTTPAQVAFLAGESMPALHSDYGGEGSKGNMDAFHAAADDRVVAWLGELLNVKQTDELGLFHPDLMMKIIRTGLASDQLVDVHALRRLIKYAHAAIILTNTDRRMKPHFERYISAK